MSELFGRAGLAAFLVTLAAIVVATSGSGGIGGRLGGLFGYDGAHLAAPDEPVTLKPVADLGLAATRALQLHSTKAAMRRARRAPRHAPARNVLRRREPAPGRPSQPSPAPAPVPAPVPAPAPTPGGTGVTGQVEQTVRQVTAPAPVVKQPTEQVIESVTQACGALKVCP